MEQETRTIEEMFKDSLIIKFYQREFDINSNEYYDLDLMCQQELSDLLKNFVEVLTGGIPVKNVFFRNYDCVLITTEDDEVIRIENTDMVNLFEDFLVALWGDNYSFEYGITELLGRHEMYYLEGDTGKEHTANSEFLLETIFGIIKSVWEREGLGE